MDEYLSVLKDKDLDLVREVEAMAELDEDGLIDLHRRVRRARKKHQGQYRRRAANRVEEQGSRGQAGPANAKARHRAAAFEELLSQVSARLAVVAHEEAEALKDQRIAQARAGRSTGPASTAVEPAGTVASSQTAGRRTTTGGAKRDASTLAQGARRQAKRDSR